jgi:hypothetical protein
VPQEWRDGVEKASRIDIGQVARQLAGAARAIGADDAARLEARLEGLRSVVLAGGDVSREALA